MSYGVLPQLVLLGQWHDAPPWQAMMALAGAIVFGMIVLPIYWGIRLARRGQEIAHTERMRALELGQPVPGLKEEPHRPGPTIAIAVPLGVFGIAFVAAGRDHNPAVWIAAALVGVAAVICGTLLTLFAPAAPPAPGDAAAKPIIDREAYDDLAQRR